MDTKYGTAILSANYETGNIIAFVWKHDITKTEQHDACQGLFLFFLLHIILCTANNKLKINKHYTVRQPY